MMSVNMQKVYDWAMEYDKTLLATDKRFSRSILVQHEEGSIFSIKSAFLIQVDNYIVCFSEHQGFFVWAQNELTFYREFEKKANEIEKVNL